MRTINLQFKGYDRLACEEWTAVETAVLATDRVAVVADNWEGVRFYVFNEPVVGDTADEAKADVILFNTQGIELTTEMAALLFRDFAYWIE
ncbi:hypothetical protein MKZ02_21100 [Pseudobacillus sp. FSL P4-0506]|uniref:hypothetical protein n=1 Tax=Pseudobacillus sp. FSL P4-0506 TaxID=2921576 RepID=UPI0030F53B2E